MTKSKWVPLSAGPSHWVDEKHKQVSESAKEKLMPFRRAVSVEKHLESASSFSKLHSPPHPHTAEVRAEARGPHPEL